MVSRSSRLSAAVAFGTMGLSAAIASAAEPTTAELMQQIQQLQTKVQQLEARQEAAAVSPAPATTPSPAEAVIRDAEARSALPELKSGYDGMGFVLQSQDGNFVLRPSFQLQARYISNYREDAKQGGTSDDWQGGFEIRRMKLEFGGNVSTKDLTYFIGFNTNRNGGSVFLEDAWAKYRFAPEWSVQAGQFKGPVHHEELVSDKVQLAVERSLVNNLIGGGQTTRTQGVLMIYDNGTSLRAMGGFHDGYSSLNTPYTEAGGTAYVGVTPTNFGLVGRVEFYVLGADDAKAGAIARKQYSHLTARDNTQDLLVIGGGMDWSQGGDSDALFHSIDVQYAPQAVKGLAFYGAYLGLLRSFDAAPAGTAEAPYDWGLLGQVSYLIDRHWEVFGRYSYTNLDEDAPDTTSPASGLQSMADAAAINAHVHEITTGVNYYIKGQNVKVTVDLSWLPKGSPTSADSVLGQPNDKDQFILRGQFQLLL